MFMFLMFCLSPCFLIKRTNLNRHMWMRSVNVISFQVCGLRFSLIILKCQIENKVHLIWWSKTNLNSSLSYCQCLPSGQYCQQGVQHFCFRCPPPASPPGRKSLTWGWNFPSSFLSQNLHNLALKCKIRKIVRRNCQVEN